MYRQFHLNPHKMSRTPSEGLTEIYDIFYTWLSRWNHIQVLDDVTLKVEHCCERK